MTTPLADLIGDSPRLQALRAEIEQVLALTKQARRLPPILIQGETGTGKGLVAQLLHRAGPRSHGAFIALNCAAIPENLLEAELFGHEAGAFTDAKKRKAGLFQAAHGGILFLDEVGLLTEALQAKLLTAIDERRVRRLGGTASEAVDVWTIAASNIDLADAAKDKTFREDLYHRLAVVTLRLPPLRERQEDVLLLARRFLARVCEDYGLPPRFLLPEAETQLRRYAWPGNVRELANVIERAALMTNERAIAPPVLGLDPVEGSARSPGPVPQDEQAGHDELLAALEKTGWNITHTAARLGVSRNTVRARMERFGVGHRSRRADRGTDPSPPPTVGAGVHSPEATFGAPRTTVPATRVLEWERRRVTLVRARFAGADPVSVAGALESVIDKALSFGGRIEGLGQSSIDISFGAVPTEDAARRAVNAALAIQRSLGQREEGASALGCTLALHTAQHLVARVGSNVQLDQADKQQATRIVETMLAHQSLGVVLVSADLVPFVERHFELVEEWGDEGHAGRVFRVIGHDPSGLGAWKRLSPFVGRDYELTLLTRQWHHACAGRGQLVGIVGDPGVGKSRLIWELSRGIEAASGLVLHTAAVVMGTASPYLAMAELVRRLVGRSGADGQRAVVERVNELLEALGLSASLLAMPLLELLGQSGGDPDWLALDPVQRKTRTVAAIKQVLFAESMRQPLVLVVEDAHWLDPESQVVLDAIVEDLPTVRILLLVAYRPEYAHPWSSRTYYTQLRVDPLSVDGAGALLDALLGRDETIEPLKPLLITWTTGNPFFLEEGMRTLVEAGVLKGQGGTYRCARPISRLDVPPTVEEVLAERINRLEARDKVVLQSAAVLGTDVALGVLKGMTEIDEDRLLDSVRRLRAAEFLYEMQSGQERSYTFKHALTQEVAYQMLAPERRRALHAMATLVGERIYADQLDDKADWLALHALRGEIWEHAVTHSQRAARRATARSANHAAAQHLEDAIAGLEHLVPGEDRSRAAIDLRLDLRHTLTRLGQVQRTLEHLRVAETLATDLKDLKRLGRVVSFITNCLILQGRYAEGIETGERALLIADQLNDSSLRIATMMYVARARLNRGECRAAIELLREVVKLLGEERSDQFLGLTVLPAAYAFVQLAAGLAEQGDFAEADICAREATRRADISGQPDSIVWAYRGLGFVVLTRGQEEAAARIFTSLLELCRTHDLEVYVPRVMAGLGCARGRMGQAAEGLVLLERAVALDTTAEQRTPDTLLRTALAEGYLLAGEIEAAARTAQEAVELTSSRGERGTQAYALWILGRAECRLLADPSRAQATLEAAAMIARELGLRPLIAHCELALADLHSSRGDKVQAGKHQEAAMRLLDSLHMRPWMSSTAA